MSAFQIKILAIAMMVVDHVGLFFFPQILWLRMLGRLAFPLFAWLIANGARHTHNIKAYLIRLFIFAVLSQVPFLFANRLVNPQFSESNVLFTLFLGLLAIALIKRTKNYSLWVFITTVLLVPAQLLHTDYGPLGVIMVVLFYIYFDHLKYMAVSLVLLFAIMVAQYWGDPVGLIEPLGLVSLVFISLYNNKPGLRTKYLFYIFYPLQYVIFYFLLGGKI